MDKTLSRAFDLLRFPMAILVVFLHIDNAPRIAVMEYDWGADWWQSSYYFSIIFVDNIAKIAVPCFFFISGYLFFKGMKVFGAKDYFTKVRSRLRSLVVPYILWNLLAAIYLYVSQGLVLRPWYLNFTEPANFPLWFLRDLIAVVLVSPLVYLIARYLKVVGSIAMAGLYVAGVVPPLWIFYFSSLFFFYLGAYCGMTLFVPKRGGKWEAVLYISATLMFAATIAAYGTRTDAYLMPVYLIVGVMAAICFSCRLIDKGVKVIPVLAASSFFVYVSHKLGATFVAKLLFDVLPHGYGTLTVRFIVAPFVAAALCLAVYVAWQKLSPRSLAFFVGRKR